MGGKGQQPQDSKGENSEEDNGNRGGMDGQDAMILLEQNEMSPEEYRRLLLEGMSGAVPEEFQRLKKRYYEELVQQ